MFDRNLRALFERLLILPALVLCIGSPGAFAASFDAGTFYISGSGDDYTGDGTEANPWRTITHTLGKTGDCGPVIVVGAGTYDYAAGERFPIDVDVAGEPGFTLQGPGDGSAVIHQGGDTYSAVDYLLQADTYVSGEITISGLDFEGSSAAVLALDQGAASVQLSNNNVTGFGLVEVDSAPHGGDYAISGNTVGGDSTVGYYTGVVNMAFGLSAESSTVTSNLTVQNNTFINNSACVHYSCPADSNEWLDVNVLIEGNTFEDCVTGVWMSGGAYSGAHYNVNEVIQDNTLTNCEYPIWFYLDANYSAVVNRDIEIANNSVSGSSSGIFFSTTIGEYLDYEETVLIAGNSITGVGQPGIYQSIEKSYTSSYLEREWSILGNTIEGCASTAIYLYQDVSWEMPEDEDGLEFDLTIDGNTLRENQAGIYIEQYASYTGDSSWNHVITRNHIHDNADFAVFISASASTVNIDHTVVLGGNVFEGNEGLSNESVIEVNIGYDQEGEYNLAFDMGTAGAYGYNTIVADASNPLSGSISCDVYMSSITAGAVSMVGNWWGTQDLLEIGDRVWDQADSSNLFAADHSSPLPDSLNFTATYRNSIGLVVSAGADAGFVPYAGDLIMTGSISGPDGASDGGDIELSWVSDDYKTMVLPAEVFDGAPLGDWNICLVNPGGQSGCANFTYPEDCSQNQSPVAVSDNAETSQGAAVVIDLTGNDSDYNGNMDPTAVTITNDPDKGTVVNNGDGTVTYTPDEDQEYTTDTFNYTVGDTCGGTSNIASCQIFIGEGENHDPVAVFDSATTEINVAVTVDILSNDTDYEGDALDVGSIVITEAPDKGSVVDNGDGTVTYTPNEGVASTTDSFNYTVDDVNGGTSNIATVEITIEFGVDSEGVTGGIGGNSDRSGTPGVRGGLGNTGTVSQGTRTP